jgi:uncharacterized tellurite resistance protein B-like protein
MSAVWQRAGTVIAITFAVSLLAIWLLSKMAGRSLGPVECLALVMMIAVAVIAFAWALLPPVPSRGDVDPDPSGGLARSVPGKTTSGSVAVGEAGPEERTEPENERVRALFETTDRTTPAERRMELNPSRMGTPGYATLPSFQSPAVCRDDRDTPALPPCYPVAARPEPAPPTKRTNSLRWIPKGESLRVGPFTLTDPMVYTCEANPEHDEASCINLELPLAQSIRVPTARLGYYPTYAALSPEQRSYYLSWLSSGRSAPLGEIGYAFLFFYGLERRLLVEGQDLSLVVKAVVRLLHAYTFSGSFDRYLGGFLAFCLARTGIEKLKDKWFDAVFGASRLKRDEDFLAVALAWFYQRDVPLPCEWALRIAKLDARCPRSVVIDRLPDQFNALFDKRYCEEFGEGLRLRASESDRALTYRPASPSLLSHFTYDSYPCVRLANVLGIQSQFSPLVSLWSSCVDELRPLSRIAAKGVELTTRAAYDALPDELKETVEHPDRPAWEALAARNAGEDGFAVVQVSALASLQGIGERAKLTLKQSETLAETAHAVGFIIERDVRVTNRPYHWDEVVSLLRPLEKPCLPTDSRYAAASLMLELGLFVAAADGEIEQEEVDQIAHFLEAQFLLDPPDARRLEALKRVLQQRPPSITGLGKRLQSALPAEQRETVGRFLVGIAAANGVIDRKEISALRGAYRALDLDIAVLNALLEEFRRESQKPAELARAEGEDAGGEVIPPRGVTPDVRGFALNQGLLGRIMADTQEVARLLGEAMRDVDGENGHDEPGQIARPRCSENPRFSGLDVRYHAVLVEILARRRWNRGDFEALVRQFSLMPLSTFEVINEWSDERFADYVILDEADGFTIQAGLIPDSP